MTPQDILTDAYAKSKKNQPGKIAAESTELLGVVNRAIRTFYIVAARMNPFFYMVSSDVPFASGGWARPATAEAVFRIEDPSDVEVVVVPFDDRKAEEELPGVYRMGQTYFPAGNANDPTSGNLTFFFSKRPTDAATLTTTIDTTFPVAYQELPVLEVAIYLAIKDKRIEEKDALVMDRDGWLRLYLAFLEHETMNERRRFGHINPFNVPSLIPIASLLNGGTTVDEVA